MGDFFGSPLLEPDESVLRSSNPHTGIEVIFLQGKISLFEPVVQVVTRALSNLQA